MINNDVNVKYWNSPNVIIFLFFLDKQNNIILNLLKIPSTVFLVFVSKNKFTNWICYCYFFSVFPGMCRQYLLRSQPMNSVNWGPRPFPDIIVSALWLPSINFLKRPAWNKSEEEVNVAFIKKYQNCILHNSLMVIELSK